MDESTVSVSEIVPWHSWTLPCKEQSGNVRDEATEHQVAEYRPVPVEYGVSHIGELVKRRKLHYRPVRTQYRLSEIHTVFGK